MVRPRPPHAGPPAPDEILNVGHPGDVLRASVRAPRGLGKALNAFLDLLYVQTTVRYSRNTFILLAIDAYLQHLCALPTVQTMAERLAADLEATERRT